LQQFIIKIYELVMKIINILLIIILLVDNTATCRAQNGSATLAPHMNKIHDLEIPKLKSHEVVSRHTGYSFSFNDHYKDANWVAYELTREDAGGKLERTNNFKPDPAVAGGTATNQDYLHYPYDRGHLAPAGDMKWSLTAMEESFYYSNVCPQDRGFNRGIWKKLEDLVRTWARQNESVYIVTGPVLTSNLQTIGPHQIGVPRYFFKVILDYVEPGIKGIGFIMENENSHEPLQHFAVTIDSVEKVTGIDFFPLLPEDQERVIESTLVLSDWSWNSTVSHGTNSGKTTVTGNHPASVQCSATTASGNRCRRMTRSSNGKCWQHGGD
jgi:endonuclease G, mitochondrial